MDKTARDRFEIYDGNGYPIFSVTVLDDEYKDTHCEFLVDKVTGWAGDGSKKPEQGCIEEYLALDVKWDGCSHYSVGEKVEHANDEDYMYDGRDGYLHLCGAQDFKNHVELLKTLYNKAYEYMNRAPLEGEEYA